MDKYIKKIILFLVSSIVVENKTYLKKIIFTLPEDKKRDQKTLRFQLITNSDFAIRLGVAYV